MLTLILYLAAVLALLLFFMAMTVYTLSLFYSSIMGSPYVPTKQKELEYILREVHCKKGKTFIELGCGDGRVVRTAVTLCKVTGIGIDINPVIIRYARFLARLKKQKVRFIVQNIFDADIRTADYIYCFLMPDLLKKMVPFLENHCKKNCVIISHGFRLPGFERFLFKTIPHSPFPTYLYRLEQ